MARLCLPTQPKFYRDEHQLCHDHVRLRAAKALPKAEPEEQGAHSRDLRATSITVSNTSRIQNKFSLNFAFICRYWVDLINEKVKSEADGKGVAFSMHQLKYLLNTSRVPGEGKDEIKNHFKTGTNLVWHCRNSPNLRMPCSLQNLRRERSIFPYLIIPQPIGRRHSVMAQNI